MRGRIGLGSAVVAHERCFLLQVGESGIGAFTATRNATTDDVNGWPSVNDDKRRRANELDGGTSRFPVYSGARHGGPALAAQPSVATQPGHHPGHPTAVGGLPASKPGLIAGAHDR